MPIPSEFLAAKSSYIENLMRHRFVYEVTRLLLLRPQIEMVRVSQGEVDDAGVDLVMTCRHVTRHIQLKTLARNTTGNAYAIAEALGETPGAAVIWISYERETFRPTHYHMLGGRGNAPLRSLADLPLAKKRNGGDRDGYRKVKITHSEYREIGICTLVEILFDLEPPFQDSELVKFSSLP